MTVDFNFTEQCSAPYAVVYLVSPGDTMSFDVKAQPISETTLVDFAAAHSAATFVAVAGDVTRVAVRYDKFESSWAVSEAVVSTRRRSSNSQTTATIEVSASTLYVTEHMERDGVTTLGFLGMVGGWVSVVSGLSVVGFVQLAGGAHLWWVHRTNKYNDQHGGGRDVDDDNHGDGAHNVPLRSPYSFSPSAGQRMYPPLPSE
eukprot:PhM_4_TR8298/c0_g2_i1/m.40570